MSKIGQEKDWQESLASEALVPAADEKGFGRTPQIEFADIHVVLHSQQGVLMEVAAELGKKDNASAVQILRAGGIVETFSNDHVRAIAISHPETHTEDNI